MSQISKEELKKLAELSRIELSEEELGSFSHDIEGILSFIKQIQEVRLDHEKNEKSSENIFEMVKNKFREDENPHKPGAYSEEILNEVPEKEGGYVKVKKIL